MENRLLFSTQTTSNDLVPTLNTVSAVVKSSFTTGNTFTISAGKISGSAFINGRDYDLSISPYGSSKINPSAATWLVIHGTDESPSDVNSICKAIRTSQPGAQILTLNWATVADQTLTVKVLGLLGYSEPDPFPVENAVPAVGLWTETALAMAGFNLANLNVVGDSYGAYVGEEVAMDAPHGINTIVALDPGQDINNDDVFSAFKADALIEFGKIVGPEVVSAYNKAVENAGAPFSVGSLNFQTDTQHSWSFYADDSFGDAATAATAADPFSVYEPEFSNGPILAIPFINTFFGSADQRDAHDNIVRIFADLITASVKDTNDTELFSLNNLLDGAPGPWTPGQIQAGPPTQFNSHNLTPIEPPQPFDAEITTKSGTIELATLVYVDKTDDETVTAKI